MSDMTTSTTESREKNLEKQRQRIIPQDIGKKLGSLIFIIAIAVIWLAKEVLSPIALAGLLALLVVPVVRALEKIKLPRVFSAIAVVTVLFCIIGSLSWFIGDQLSGIVKKMPSYESNIKNRLADLRGDKLSVLQIADATLTHLKNDISKENPIAQSGDTLTKGQRVDEPEKKPILVRVDSSHDMNMSDVLAVVISILQPIATVGIVVLFSIFMLTQRDDLRHRFLRLSSRWVGKGGTSLSAEALDEASDRITHYLLMQSLTNCASGFIIGIGLFFLGVPNPFLWGLMTFLLRFVPYLGILLSASIVLFFTVAVSPDWNLTWEAIALFLGVEVIIGNVVEPLFFAHGTGLSSIAVIVAATFWTWIWGPVGLFLSVPLTVCLVVTGRYVPALDFLEILLSDRPEIANKNKDK